MRHAIGAGHHSGTRQGCLKGTRKEVLQQIKHWLVDEKDQRVFWLNGLAGTGKTTISQTFANMCFADGTLGASFFCSRDFEDRSNLHMIFPTLAFQLAYQYPQFRKQLLQVLRTNPDVGSLYSQMEKLIVRPLKTTCIPALIIIDALDECKDEEPASAILSILSRFVDQIPSVKFFITGRPEPRIRSGFRLAALRPITEVFKLHDVQRSLVDMDIKLFFNTHLTEIAKHRSYSDLTEEWPSTSDINILCEKAGGLFIYASTVVKFVSSQHHHPTERLTLLVSLPQSTHREGQSGIDTLYTQVLIQAFHDMDSDSLKPDDQEFFHHLRSVVGAVLLVFNPLSMKSLSDLLTNFNTLSKISTALRSFHSLLLIPDSAEDPIHPFHKSFPDFLMDPERCKDERFFVDPPVYHSELLFSCLNLMKKKLRRNICNLDDHAVLSRVEDLSTHRKLHIGDALGYACCFWTKHLIKTPINGQDAEEVQKAIDEFFTTYLPFWIEVLAVMGNLDTGVYAINDIQQWYISVSYDYFVCKSPYLQLIQAGLVCKWADDSQHLILEYFDIIHNSPSKIYHNALPFSPSSSWLHECYSSELSQEVKVVKGLQAKWGTCSRTVSFDDIPLALSCWKDLIAVGLRSGGIVIVDAITGVYMSVLFNHTDQVNSLAFSLDGTFLVSGSSDNTANLWDIQTGGVIKTFHGHTRPVWSVSISPDCSVIASGSLDNTIQLWDAQTWVCYCVIDGHSDDVNSVSFSPTNPKLLISASDDGTIRQWGVDGHQIGSTYKGQYFAFSSDGSHFVSWKWQGTVARVQDSDSGGVVAELKSPGDYFQCCCLSPGGKFVAGGDSNTIYIWDITGLDPCLVETLTGHGHNITSLTFSSSLISSSQDKSIKFWQIGTSSADPVAPGSESSLLASVSILSISLQATDGIAISSDSDGVVKTWDILTGLYMASFQTPAGDNNWRDAQLIEGRMTCVWLSDQKIHFWDTENYRLHIWDTEKGEHQMPDAQFTSYVKDLRISGDGSKVFVLDEKFIQAWSIQTGEVVGKVGLEAEPLYNSLIVDGSRVWFFLEDLKIQGWDFGVSDSTPIPLSNTSPDKPHLVFLGTQQQDTSPSRIEDMFTKKEVFQLSGRCTKPFVARWDGRYLIAGYQSGEVLILDFNNMIPH